MVAVRDHSGWKAGSTLGLVATADADVAAAAVPVSEVAAFSFGEQATMVSTEVTNGKLCLMAISIFFGSSRDSEPAALATVRHRPWLAPGCCNLAESN